MSCSDARDPGPGIHAAFAASLAATGMFLVAGAAILTLSGGGSIPVLGDMSALLAISVMAFMVAAFHAFGIGLTVRAFLPRRMQASLLVNLFASFLIGAIPMPLLALLLTLASGGTDIVYTSYLIVAAGFGGLGMAGGFVFWLLVRDHELAGLDNGEAGR